MNSALGIPTSKNNISETMETLDPDGEGYIIYEPFLAYAALRLNLMAEEQDEESRAEEVQMSYNLFTRNGSGPITMAHLRRVAKTIREDVDDNTLKDMIMEANGTGKDGWKNGVTLEQFEAVLQRAGVYSAP
jgi:Ca2+-binding EF-hand superfamily protein